MSYQIKKTELKRLQKTLFRGKMRSLRGISNLALCALRILTGKKQPRSNKTPVLRKSTNMGVWAVGTLNQLFLRGS